MPVDRSPAVPRLVVQMRSNAAKGVPNTQRQLAADMNISQGRVSELLWMATRRGLIERSPSVSPSVTRAVRAYQLTQNGRIYATEQLQGAGTCK